MRIASKVGIVLATVGMTIGLLGSPAEAVKDSGWPKSGRARAPSTFPDRPKSLRPGLTSPHARQPPAPSPGRSQPHEGSDVDVTALVLLA